MSIVMDMNMFIYGLSRLSIIYENNIDNNIDIDI